jgi:hypothetical protein
MTVVYGPEDALYNTGRYGVARYNSVGPTKQITGVSSLFDTGDLTATGKASKVLLGYLITSDIGAPTLSAEASTLPTGVSAVFSLGEVDVKSINKVEVLGLPAVFVIGELTVEGGTGFTAELVGFSLQSGLGTVKPNLITFVSGVSATINLNPVNSTGKASVALSGNTISIEEGVPIVSAVVFDFNQFSENYSNKRTVYIPKTHVPEVA